MDLQLTDQFLLRFLRAKGFNTAKVSFASGERKGPAPCSRLISAPSSQAVKCLKLYARYCIEDGKAIGISTVKDLLISHLVCHARAILSRLEHINYARYTFCYACLWS
jgi:hypothetical protein